MHSVQFEIESYCFDVYVDKKHVGTIHPVVPDRTVFGYQGRKELVLMEDLMTKKGKRIKKGTVIVTELIPICGKLIK